MACARLSNALPDLCLLVNAAPLTATPVATAAYLLVAHGSRSRQAQDDFAHLAASVREQLRDRGDRSPWLATACLELAPQPLHQQIASLAQQAQRDGRSRLAILPLFLQPGVHACDDLPAEFAQAQPAAPLPCQLLPYLGEQPAFLASLEGCFAATPQAARLLLAHGSRRPDSDRPLRSLAAGFGAELVCWAVPPFLADQVAACYARGARALAIQPYFLFAGRLTAAIAAEVARLQALYPEADLQLQPPLAATEGVAAAIAEILAAIAPS